MGKRPLSERKIQVVSAVKTKENETRQKRKLRVAAYCRVSTDSKEQETSFDSQVAYYSTLIANNPDWDYVGIYADPAISGTSRKNRAEFNRMLYDCIRGKIDMIITKSMSRFARNQLDSLAVIRMLNGLHPPVRILFEDDHINSDDLSSEIIIVFTSMLAEQESVKKSTNVKWGFERRKEQGFYLVPTQNLVGYDKTNAANKDEREIYIVEDEAIIVRTIFLMFLAGYKVGEIAFELTRAGVKTGKGNTTWNSNSVIGILRNERYAGDVRTNKTYRENLWTKKVIQNKGEVSYVYETDHHPAIISHEAFDMAQRLLASHKYGYDPFVNGTYALTVIEDGLLKGFIPINVHWAGSKLEEYIELSGTVEQTQDAIVKGHGFRYFPGCQVVRRQDISCYGRVSARITPNTITLNRASLTLFDSDYIELLFNPIEKLIAVRPSEKGMPGALNWKKVKDDKTSTVPMGCSAFSLIVYELMNWPKLWNNTMLGMIYKKGSECVILFDLTQRETSALPYEKPTQKKKRNEDDIFYNIEAMIARQLELLHNRQTGDLIIQEEEEIEERPMPKRQPLKPDDWTDTFGPDSITASISYRRYQFESLHEWDIFAHGIRSNKVKTPDLASEEEIQQNLVRLRETVTAAQHSREV